MQSPVQIVWGREAASPTVESADLWLHALPEAELEVIERAGVFPHAEQPEAFVERVARFVGSLAAA
jgi:pimeloyl-ACP methyl ester carboxylesterase